MRGCGCQGEYAIGLDLLVLRGGYGWREEIKDSEIYTEMTEELRGIEKMCKSNPTTYSLIHRRNMELMP
jgi:hypothetical protein